MSISKQERVDDLSDNLSKNEYESDQYKNYEGKLIGIAKKLIPTLNSEVWDTIPFKKRLF